MTLKEILFKIPPENVLTEIANDTITLVRLKLIDLNMFGAFY